MSIEDYNSGQALELLCLRKEISFYGVIQCAMRKADSNNLESLKMAFPKTWEDLQARYNAPGGVLPGDIKTITDRDDLFRCPICHILTPERITRGRKEGELASKHARISNMEQHIAIHHFGHTLWDERQNPIFCICKVCKKEFHGKDARRKCAKALLIMPT